MGGGDGCRRHHAYFRLCPCEFAPERFLPEHRRTKGRLLRRDQLCDMAGYHDSPGRFIGFNLCGLGWAQSGLWSHRRVPSIRSSAPSTHPKKRDRGRKTFGADWICSSALGHLGRPIIERLPPRLVDILDRSDVFCPRSAGTAARRLRAQEQPFEAKNRQLRPGFLRKSCSGNPVNGPIRRPARSRERTRHRRRRRARQAAEAIKAAPALGLRARRDVESAGCRARNRQPCGV